MNFAKTGSILFIISLLLVGSGAFLVPTKAHAECINIARDLSLRSKGADVRSLQAFLVSRNYPGGGSWMITGTFGPATQVAVRNFQKESGLAITGRVDLATRLEIDRVACGGATPAPISVAPAPTSNPFFFNTANYTPSILPASIVPVQPIAPQVVIGSNGYQSPCSLQGTYAGTQYGISCPCVSGMYGSQCVTTAPEINGLDKTSGGVGTSVTVYGSGFSTQGNSVRFGNAVIPSLSSLDGRSLSFTIPATSNGFGSDTMHLGQYLISVSNSFGMTSGNTLPFQVTSLINGSTGILGLSATGPSTVQTGVSNSFNVTLNNQTGTSVQVSVNWGDQGLSGAQTSQPVSANILGSQLLTFTHSFAQSGTYTVQFTANNNQGIIQTTNLTVIVSGTATGGTINSISISSVSPMQGVRGQQLTITGSGFTNYDNVVHFGSGGTRFVISNGNSITYTIPYAVSECDVAVAGCASPSVAVIPGTYPLYITNGNGTSNTIFVNVQ